MSKLKIFEQFPPSCKCPICETNGEGKSILVAIAGTREGWNIEAKPVHLDCLDNLMYNKESELIYVTCKNFKKGNK